MTYLPAPQNKFRHSSNAALIAHANQLANDEMSIAEAKTVCDLLREMAWRLALMQQQR